MATKDNKETSQLVQNIIDFGSKKAAAEEKAPDLPGRKLKNWLKYYLEYTSGQEAPEIFHLWSGISAIGASTRRNVYMYKRYYKMYPNLFVVLIATSADCKKSTAIDLIKDFYREKKMQRIRQIEDKMSTEGLLQKMATGMDADAMAEDNNIKHDGSIYIMADEMAVMLSNVSYVSGLVEVLTSAYQCRPSFSHTLRRNSITIHNPCLNLLGASTPEWLATGMPEYSKSGGFLGRFIFVVAHKPKRKIPFPEDEGDEDEHIELREKLIHDLWIISRLKGRFAWGNSEAKGMYGSWYEEYTPGEDPRLKEYYARKKDTVLKLAMILSMSTSNSLVIGTQHIIAAFKAIDNVEGDMVDAFMFLGSTAESQLGRVVLTTLSNVGAKGMSRSTLLRAVSHRVRRVGDFDDVLEMLRQEDKIEKEMREGGKLFYRVTTAEERREAATERRRKSSILKNLFNKDGSYVK